MSAGDVLQAILGWGFLSIMLGSLFIVWHRAVWNGERHDDR